MPTKTTHHRTSLLPFHAECATPDPEKCIAESERGCKCVKHILCILKAKALLDHKYITVYIGYGNA
eukprot:6455097-Amphidinium_carterae.1